MGGLEGRCEASDWGELLGKHRRTDERKGIKVFNLLSARLKTEWSFLPNSEFSRKAN